MRSKRFHIIVDMEGIKPEIINDKVGLKSFLDNFPPLIGMRALHDPVIVEGVPQDPGISGFVIVDFSHISVHTFYPNCDALVDIFSCKPFDKEKAINEALKYFKVKKDQARIKEVYWR